MEIGTDRSEVPVEITNKLSTTPLENATWHEDLEKGYTPVEETTDAALKTSKVEDNTSGRKKVFKNFLYTMHLYTNIKCKICNKLKNMLKIYITI